jgi:hypothetical protein
MRHSHADETDTAVQESKGHMSIFVVWCCLTASGTSCVSSWMSGLYEVECRGKHLRCVGKHLFFSFLEPPMLYEYDVMSLLSGKALAEVRNYRLDQLL